jgi:glutamate decarboxylase
MSRKFARYFEVEERIIPVCKESNYGIDLTKIRKHLDENTIGTGQRLCR